MPKEKLVLSIYYPHKSINFGAVTSLLLTLHRNCKQQQWPRMHDNNNNDNECNIEIT